MSFWNNLKRPFIVMAPLADVTDAAFRRMIAKYSAHTRADGTVGGPDVMWTEFVSADGLMRADAEGKAKLMKDLMYGEEERPIVAQLFSSHPEYMEGAARLCRELGFDGIDINMGCPDRGIEKQGAGAAMIRNPGQARAIIAAAKRGAGDLPVSVKTRLGYNTDELETWLPEILEENPAAVTIHARTRKEMSKVPARWERVARAVEIRNSLQGSTLKDNQGQTLIIGNGDVVDLEDAQRKASLSCADGVMLGRAIFGNPWLFHPSKRLPERMTAPKADASPLVGVKFITVEERLRVLVEHTYLFEKLLPHKNFAIMKKHYKAYVNGFDGAKELRQELMEMNTAADVDKKVAEFLGVKA